MCIRDRRGDGARSLQILLNLVGNALKFTTNGDVRIDVSTIEGGIRFRISDTGIGIPKEKQASIFDRFTQVDITDQRRYGGAGLGLSIVSELVDLHNGRITLESEVGQGTAFIVDLPLRATDAPARTEAPRQDTALAGSLSGRTVLVAEDNEMNALVTTETIRRYYPGARTLVVHTGREALDQLADDEDGDIAVVLMDVQMPEMDGMTATRRIRELNDDRARVPVIALTASVLPSDLSRCLEAGMDACVSKPFKAEELLRAIGKLTGDHGVPAGVGFDVHDPQVALFHWLVPPRLNALKEAMEGSLDEDVLRIVHALRPQLVERDAMRFATLCDRILKRNGSGDVSRSDDVRDLVSAIESALA